MRTINDALALGNLVNIVDENRAFLRQIIDDTTVMDNFLAHVNRRAKSIQRDADNINRADNARAETARLQQQDAFCGRIRGL